MHAKLGNGRACLDCNRVDLSGKTIQLVVERRLSSVAAAEVNLAHAIARPYTYEKDPRGHLGVLADTDRRVLSAALTVSPSSLSLRAEG